MSVKSKWKIGLSKDREKEVFTYEKKKKMNNTHELTKRNYNHKKGHISLFSEMFGTKMTPAKKQPKISFNEKSSVFRAYKPPKKWQFPRIYYRLSNSCSTEHVKLQFSELADKHATEMYTVQGQKHMFMFLCEQLMTSLNYLNSTSLGCSDFSPFRNTNSLSGKRQHREHFFIRFSNTYSKTWIFTLSF